LTASALPQSSQNTDAGAFSAPHFGQRLDSELPHAAQNFLPVVLSVPHFVQRIATTFPQADGQVSRLDGPIDRREPGQQLKTHQVPHDQIGWTIAVWRTTLERSFIWLKHSRPRLTLRPRRRRREHRLVQFRRERVELPTARPGGGDSSSKPSSDVRRNQIPRVRLANEGNRRDPKQSRIPGEQNLSRTDAFIRAE
jgi:hypothetical protein